MKGPRRHVTFAEELEQVKVFQKDSEKVKAIFNTRLETRVRLRKESKGFS